MSVVRGKALDGLELLLSNPALQGKDRKFIEACISCGDIKIGGQISGLAAGNYPYIKVGLLKKKFGPQESRSGKPTARPTTTLQHLTRRHPRLRDAMQRLQRLADDVSNTPASRTYASSKIADLEWKTVIQMERVDAIRSAAQKTAGVEPLVIEEKIRVLMFGSNQELEKLKQGGRFL